MDLKKFWDCIKKSYRKLSFYELITMVFFAFVISGIIVGDVLAADNVTMKYQVPIVGGQNPQTLPLYINVVYKWLMGAGLVLVGIMVTIGGFMYVSSGGDAKTIGTGKKYIINALIGMLLLSSAYLILNTINPDATEMEDIVVKQVEGEVLKNQIEVPLGCECHANKDCVNAATSSYFCDWSSGGRMVYDASNKSFISQKLDPYAEAIIVDTILVAVAFGTAGTGIPAYLASKAAAAGKTALTVGKVIGKAAWATFKFTFKWVILPTSSFVAGAVISNPALVFMGLMMLAGGAAFDFNTEIVKKCNPPSGEVKGVCLPNAFRYARLKTHGAGPTDVDLAAGTTNKNGMFSIYNTDGTLPKRDFYFRDQVTYSMTINQEGGSSLSADSITHFYRGGSTDGIVNTDGCASYIKKYEENYCPCIEWEDGFMFTKCKKQASCATIEMEGVNIYTVGAGGTYSQGPTLKSTQLCLTGTEGEMCKTNDDCGKGLECVSLEELGKAAYGDEWRKFAIKYSTFRKSVRTSLTDLGSVGTIKGGWDRDKVCMYSKNADKASLTLSLKKTLMGIADIGELDCMAGLEKSGDHKIHCTKMDVPVNYCGMLSSDVKLENYLKAGTAVKMSEALYDEALKLLGNTKLQVYDNLDSYVGASAGNATDVFDIKLARCDYFLLSDNDCAVKDVLGRVERIIRTTDLCTRQALDSYNRNYIRKNADNYKDNYSLMDPDEYYKFTFDYSDFKSFCEGVDDECSCDLKGLQKMSLIIPEVVNGPIKHSFCLKNTDKYGIYNYNLFVLLVQP